MSVMGFLRRVFGREKIPLLEDKIPPAFEGDDIPYRTVEKVLDARPVTEAELQATEAALVRWLWSHQDHAPNWAISSENLWIPSGVVNQLTAVNNPALKGEACI